MSLKLREWTEEFIDIYRSEPCLWQIKNAAYHDRGKKEAAYEKLVTKLREIDSGANKEAVIKKINNLRCCYKKEHKKIVCKSGSGLEDLYEPKLWYYPLMSFLNDQYVPRPSRSNLDTNNETDTEELLDTPPESQTATTDFDVDPLLQDLPISASTSTTSTINTSAATPSTTSLPTRPKRNVEAALRKDVLLSVQNHFKRPPHQDDRYDNFGKVVAMKLRGFENTQRIFAEKIINEALFEAEMENLTISHRVMIPTTMQLYSHSTSPSARASTLHHSNISPIQNPRCNSMQKSRH